MNLILRKPGSFFQGMKCVKVHPAVADRIEKRVSESKALLVLAWNVSPVSAATDPPVAVHLNPGFRLVERIHCT